ncbi:septal ring assembly protein ZapB [Vibrio sp. qd031]|jgi:cell division protein ZapB|uniref:Cell division protein ZapB n=1 Tax=Vibrio ulleungensis TaxID=2807619 RepID=A0ABS2HPF5_9VIBR|nr:MULTISPECIES: cell division protein ZapB [Vibrio]MBM7037756.1 cell division protein ZapB [Vibrio ulleungensis]ORT51918.1 septal ring assembly protein ZapB [Vibrio sp. qd031]
MSLEVLEQLEQKIQTAVDTIALLQMEVEELKEQKGELEQKANSLQSGYAELEQQNAQLKTDHEAWQTRIRGLLGKMEEVE